MNILNVNNKQRSSIKFQSNKYQNIETSKSMKHEDYQNNKDKNYELETQQLQKYLDNPKSQPKTREKLPQISLKGFQSLQVSKNQQQYQLFEQKKNAIEFQNQFSERYNRQLLNVNSGKKANIKKQKQNNQNLMNPKKQDDQLELNRQEFQLNAIENDQQNIQSKKYKIKKHKSINQKKQIVGQQRINQIMQPLSKQKQKNHNKSQEKSQEIDILSNLFDANSHKYYNQVMKLFPEAILDHVSYNNLLKLNDNARITLKKLNEKIDELLKQNILQLTKKKQDRSKQLEKKLKLLNQEKFNNKKILERMASELKKLKLREEQIKQDDYETQIYKKIQQYSSKKQQVEKQLLKIKLQINNEGKRLSNVGQHKFSELYQNTKIQLSKLRKQQQKNCQFLKEFQNKISTFEVKTKQIQEKLNNVSEAAIKNGINIETIDASIQQEQLKKKKIALLKKQQSILSHFKIKKQKLMQQNLLLQRDIQNFESKVQKLSQQNNYIIKISMKEIEKLKQNPKHIKSIQEISKIVITDKQKIKKLQNKSVKTAKNIYTTDKITNRSHNKQKKPIKEI